ncbi:KUP/HAK/KT family potassium transporter (plasmid) [Polymorphobacter megasporae]|nr:KUP/HAK/KT family potassium transporter [Polymorphobacter megasporae]
MASAPAAPGTSRTRGLCRRQQGGVNTALTLKLTLGAIGIGFGDSGTSPLYAFRETFAGHHTLIVDRLHVFGVLSLIFWSMMIVVTPKYVTILMRAAEGADRPPLTAISIKISKSFAIEQRARLDGYSRADSRTTPLVYSYMLLNDAGGCQSIPGDGSF